MDEGPRKSAGTGEIFGPSLFRGGERRWCEGNGLRGGSSIVGGAKWPGA